MEGTRALKTWRGDYDFAVDGGAVGSITLRSNDGPLPVGAVIKSGFIDVQTACLSATGTMALSAESAGDLLAAVGQAGVTAGRKSVVPAGTGVTAVKLTAARNPTLAIATAAFTAGKFTLVIDYV
ncbi:MAG: hypothetical protein AB7G23_19265 [Vicinamibacterales bacterium]